MNEHRYIRFMPDNWLEPFAVEDLFPPGKPVEVDLGCGKGRFLLEHAERNPHINFLGVDRMLRRVRKVERAAIRRNLENVRVMRLDGYYAVAYLLPRARISAYYIFFPDPWPKKKHHDNRLFNAHFLDALCQTLVPAGVLHFATDHLPYFEEVQALLQADPRFESIEPFIPPPEEKTDFERIFHDQPIGRCSFRMSQKKGGTLHEVPCH